MIGQADDEDNTDDHDNQFFAINEFPSQGITHKTETELTNDVTDVGCGIDGATEQEWICWALLVLQTTPVSNRQINLLVTVARTFLFARARRAGLNTEDVHTRRSR